MSDLLNSETKSGQNLIPPSQEQTDALLEMVKEQMDLDTFNPNDHELLKRIIESLGDSRGLVRMRVAETLGQIGELATPFLMEALADHPNVVVRRASAKTLTIIADPKAVPVLVHSFLNDEDTVVQGSSVGALARTGETAVPPLLEILADSNSSENTKGHAAWALAFIGAQAKEYIYKVIDSSSPDVRAAVIGAIAKILQENPQEEAFGIVVKALGDPDTNVRCEAAAVLGNLSYRPAVAHLISLLHHPDWQSRKAAALALMKIGDRTALEPLQAALGQESEIGVQPVIKLAISQIEKQSQQDDDWE
ncbi:HEAT repeat domain-containing protein [Brasilonema octagenarum UFV-E1]|uniref:HEAT repeat domain-containing protein n=2 Tax=Brasilonema TaxID=383614 RepID=A0A856M8M3_9CYAN|nr:MULTISPECIES: HEAT repeat domain-containing protein [Brasilonema]NMF65920.1 HEAT repeat domain-containing protein [Brasilonema octagenarum UFV-OR1]QDL07525.1 HEAT repeat domain-containing protein [Brasilonema sennae CENA114]QDL13887.1 HEAT repeat domain-containing protein [Brasilonema octagenarum UFV-E1]